MFVVIGVGLMAAMAAFDYRRLRDWAIPIAGGRPLPPLRRPHPARHRVQGHPGLVRGGRLPAPARRAGQAGPDHRAGGLPHPGEGGDRRQAPGHHPRDLGRADGAHHAAARPRARCWSSAYDVGHRLRRRRPAPALRRAAAHRDHRDHRDPEQQRPGRLPAGPVDQLRQPRAQRRRQRLQPATVPDGHRRGPAPRPGPVRGHPDRAGLRARAAHRLHLHGGGGGARLRRRRARARLC